MEIHQVGLNTYEGTVLSATEKSTVDELGQERFTLLMTQPPEPLCLRCGQAETGHFGVL